ncbi:MAG: histidine kinase [Salinivirgaceae bacterium]|nr:histidine kinase [Salinivirgaceae bacterium]
MKKTLLSFIVAAVLLLLPSFNYAQGTESEQVVSRNQHENDSLLNIIKPDSPNSLKAEIYSNISYRTYDLDTSIKYANLALKCCDEDYPKRDSLLAYNYNNLAFAYYMKDESRKALQYRLKSASIYKKHSDKRREAGTFIHVGNCYLDLNIKDSVFYYYNKALVLLTELQDTIFLIESYNNLGQIYQSMELYDNAVKNYQKALDYAIAKKSKTNMACCYCYLGTVISLQSDTLIDLAIENLTKSVRMFESNESVKHYDVEDKHYAYYSLADAYIKAAELKDKKTYADSCYKYIQKASTYYLTVGSIANYVSCRYCYVKYLFFYKKYRDALAELLRLDKYQTDDRSTSSLATHNRYLYEVYSNLGDYKNALKFHEKYMEYQMAYVNENTLNSIKDAEVERTHLLDSVNHHYETLQIKAEHQNELRQKQLQTRLLMCIAVIIIMFGVVFFFFYKTTRENIEMSLRQRMLETERSLLRTQMNPHFIFNALNSVQSFITSNNQLDAVRFLSKFAKLMRMILDHSMQQFVPLSNELTSLSLYIDLEKARFNNRFNYRIDVDGNVDEELLNVPPMLIQPFVENAILHGLMHKPEGGLIVISITDNGDKTLTCQITDNGVGRKAAAEIEKGEKAHKSVGMQLTRERLQDLNQKTKSELSYTITDLEDADGKALGTQVTIVMPVQV